MRDLFAPSRRAFSGFGSFYALRPIDADEWRRGLRERFAADGCEVAEAALAQIVELGDGHPRATMRIAQQTHLVSLELDTREIDLDLVQVGFELLGARTVAAGQPLPKRLHPGVRDRVLKLLRDAGIVEHQARGRWRVIDPLLRRYLVSLDPVA